MEPPPPGRLSRQQFRLRSDGGDRTLLVMIARNYHPYCAGLVMFSRRPGGETPGNSFARWAQEFGWVNHRRINYVISAPAGC